MILRAGVLIIGSLRWGDCEGRPEWRADRLSETDITPVSLPIRYGRFSCKRQTYTMVFSTLGYKHKELGRGIVLPFRRQIKSFESLADEADCLATAEGLKQDWTWGAVGLLKNPEVDLPSEFAEKWTNYFRAKTTRCEVFTAHSKSERRIIDLHGILHIRWPVVVNRREPGFDLLLATQTKPRMKNPEGSSRYPSPLEIAREAINAPAPNYFVKNVSHGIRTTMDVAIWRAMTKLKPECAAEYPDVAALLDDK